MDSLHKLFKGLTWEFLLDYYPNGGTIVFLRTLFTSIQIFILTIIASSWASQPSCICGFLKSSADIIPDRVQWFGAIFAATYVVFYSRFSSQWSYLADLYNQIMQTRVTILAEAKTENEKSVVNKLLDKEHPLSKWMAGFIEDADALHLAGKPMFAATIQSMLGYPGVKDAFTTYTVNGTEKLEKLNKMLAKYYPKKP
jgi:hypothetical protein